MSHYAPETPVGLGPEAQAYLQRELDRISAAFNALEAGSKDVINVAPNKPRNGDFRFADGTNWDPGDGRGLYLRDTTYKRLALASEIITPTDEILPGMLFPTIRTTAPAGWLLCDGSEKDATVYVDLFDEMFGDIDNWGRSTKVGDFTADNSTDVLTLNSHGLTDNNVVHMNNTGGGLPAGLSSATKYFIITATTNTFQVSLTSGGSAVDFTTNGTGTHHIYDSFVLPDLRGRNPLGKDNMGGSSANRVTDTEADSLGQSEGAETHALTEAETGTHSHGVTDVGHVHSIQSVTAAVDGVMGSTATS